VVPSSRLPLALNEALKFDVFAVAGIARNAHGRPRWKAPDPAQRCRRTLDTITRPLSREQPHRGPALDRRRGRPCSTAKFAASPRCTSGFVPKTPLNRGSKQRKIPPTLRLQLKIISAGPALSAVATVNEAEYAEGPPCHLLLLTNNMLS